jgi:hypothetical protein
MPKNSVYVIKNSLGVICASCNGVHEYLTLKSDDAPCDAPGGFSQEVARNMAKLHAKGAEDVLLAPDLEVVVLHPSARKLPTRREPALGHFHTRERLA